MSRLTDYLTGAQEPNSPQFEKARQALHQAMGPTPSQIADKVVSINLARIHFGERENHLVASIVRSLTE